MLHNANGYLGGGFKVTVSSGPNASFLSQVNANLGGGFKVNDFIAYMHQSSNLKSTPKIGIGFIVSDISHIIVSVLGRALASDCADLHPHTYQHHVTILLSGMFFTEQHNRAVGFSKHTKVDMSRTPGNRQQAIGNTQ